MRDLSLVLLFIKAPEKGTVKSRLSKKIGEDAALDIYKCLVQDTLKTLDSCQYPFRVIFWPPHSGGIVKDWLGEAYSYLPQQGEDLGERMKNALIQAFAGNLEKVLVIGSDIPDLTASLISGAFDALDNCDAVIGPSVDGGYYLIGFNRDSFLPDVFHGMAWGTESVFNQTMDVLKMSGLRVHVLKELMDIDTFDDLLLWSSKGPDGPCQCINRTQDEVKKVLYSFMQLKNNADV